MTALGIEGRAFAFLSERAGVELCEACSLLPQRCESVRQALYRLRKRGQVETVKTGSTRFFFVVLGAARPVDNRGR